MWLFACVFLKTFFFILHVFNEGLRIISFDDDDDDDDDNREEKKQGRWSENVPFWDICILGNSIVISIMFLCSLFSVMFFGGGVTKVACLVNEELSFFIFLLEPNVWLGFTDWSTYNTLVEVHANI